MAQRCRASQPSSAAGTTDHGRGAAFANLRNITMPSQSSGGTLAQRVPHKRGRFGFGLAPALLRRLLSCIAFGSLIVETPTGERVRAVSRHEGPEATLILHRWRALRRLATKGDIGFAEGYIDGDWSSPDLTALIQLASVNTPALKRLMRGSAMLRAVHRLSHVPAIQHPRRKPSQHRVPLRSRERFLFPLARPQHDIFVRALCTRRADAGGRSGREVQPDRLDARHPGR